MNSENISKLRGSSYFHSTVMKMKFFYFLKKINAHKTFITTREMKRPGHKSIKDRLTLTLSTNGSENLKI